MPKKGKYKGMRGTSKGSMSKNSPYYGKKMPKKSGSKKGGKKR